MPVLMPGSAVRPRTSIVAVVQAGMTVAERASSHILPVNRRRTPVETSESEGRHFRGTPVKRLFAVAHFKSLFKHFWTRG